MWDKLYEKGLGEYPLPGVIGQNLFLVTYFGVAAIGMLPLQMAGIPVVSLAYMALVGMMLVLVLRKHVCTHCFYYGKRCNTGWGKLACMLFKKNSGDYELGGKLANITWMLAAITPIIGMIIGLALNWFSTTTAILLAVFTVMSGVNFVVHKNSCKNCKMRFICPGSAAK